MVSKRLLVGGGLLLSVSGCNHLFPPSAQYASLAPAAMPATGPGTVIPEVNGPEAAMPDVAIPGTLLGRGGAGRGAVEPYTALKRTATARARWEAQPRVDYAKIEPPVNLTGRALRDPPAAEDDAKPAEEPHATASVRAGKGTLAAGTGVLGPSYDREKMMSDLLDEGAKAARSICNRC
jgi:hypothetical protein